MGKVYLSDSDEEKYEEGRVLEIPIIQTATHAEQEEEMRINVNPPFAFHSSSFARSHINNFMQMPLRPPYNGKRKKRDLESQ